MRPSILLVLAAAAACGNRQAVAQSLPSTGSTERNGRPTWLTAWSPLNELGELGRTLPTAPASAGTVLYPATKIGLFWTAANPGAVALEMASGRTEFDAGLQRAEGSYKRPLDGDVAARRGLAGLSWLPLGENGAVIGQAVFDESRPEGRVANIVSPFGSSPFVVTDTAASGFRNTRAILEGATGWRFGNWGVGLSGGYEVLDNRTRRDPVPTMGRSTRPAAAAGVVRQFAAGAFTVGLHGRWQGRAETAWVLPVGATGLAHQLAGYYDPPDLVMTTNPYFRRIESDALAGTLSAGGVLVETRWLVFGEFGELKADETSVRANDPQLDSWRTSSTTVGGAFQRHFGEQLLITLDAKWAAVKGEAQRADIEGIVFRSDEQAFATTLEARLLPTRSPWEAALGVTLQRETRFRSDALAEVASDIKSWNSGINVELARWFGSKVGVSAGYAHSFYTTDWAIPSPAAMGPVYRELIGPELALYATQSQPMTARLAARWQFREATAFYLRGQYSKLSASAGSGTVPLAPDGERTGWGIALGVVLGVRGL